MRTFAGSGGGRRIGQSDCTDVQAALDVRLRRKGPFSDCQHGIKRTHAGHLCNADSRPSPLSSLVNNCYAFHRPLPRSIFHPEYAAEPTCLGELLRKIRLDLGMNMRQVAEEVGVFHDTVIDWEVRGRKPTKERFACLRQFYKDRGHSLAKQLDLSAVVTRRGR